MTRGARPVVILMRRKTSRLDRSATLLATLVGVTLFSIFWRRVADQDTRLLRGSCRVRPRFYTPLDYDAAEVNVTVPLHVSRFDSEEVVLPKYPSSEILLVSVSSNNTYERQVAQKNTFGRIFDLRFVTDRDFPQCVLCWERDLDETCHCPEFRSRCGRHVFHERSLGWWCATRKALTAIQVALDTWKEEKLPKWLFLLDDNTWVNPISLPLMIEHLSPDRPYFIGVDYGGFLAGGPGQLMSRAVLQKLLGPPVTSPVVYHWENGTHGIVPSSQLHSCIARMQGGDWCFFHGDWALAACLKELGISPMDAGSKTHSAFFSQFVKCCDKKEESWFGISSEIASLLHHTHAIGLHVEPDEMYDIFYRRIVPSYQNLVQSLRRE